MLIASDPISLARTLASPIADNLRLLLSMRAELIDLATFVIVAPGDTMTEIEKAAGVPIATNLVDGSRYGDSEYMTCFEWVANYNGLYEMPIILSDDGSGVILIVPDSEGIDPVLLAIAREHAEPANENDADQLQDGGPIMP